MARLGYLKSQKLDAEVKEIEEKEEKELSKKISADARSFDFGRYENLVANLRLNEFPQIPYEAFNAIVINLFCID